MGRSAQFLEAFDAYDSGDTERALRLMICCAEQGDPVACFTVALWYRDGEGVRTDIGSSQKWMGRLESLAKEGNIEGQWELGQHYRFGDLFPKDISLANYWLERAAEGGWADAQHHLAWYLETGQYGFPIDPKAAEEWYRRAFEQGHPETIYVYAMRAFHDGQPTPQALALLRSAAKKGLKQASEVLSAFTH